MVGIYKITNKINGKVYIGQSIDIERRWETHRKRNSIDDSFLYRAIRKHGLENFKFEIIEECLQIELNDKEKFWIRHYNSWGKAGYNLTQGGEHRAFVRLNHTILEEITNMLEKNEITQNEIAHKLGVNKDTVSLINHGRMHYRENINYPIRKKKKKINVFCIDCDKLIGVNATRCPECHIIHSRTVKRPTRKELKKLIRTKSFLSIGRKYNVKDNTIRKWCNVNNLPNKKRKIQQYSGEEWNEI